MARYIPFLLFLLLTAVETHAQNEKSENRKARTSIVQDSLDHWRQSVDMPYWTSARWDLNEAQSTLRSTPLSTGAFLSFDQLLQGQVAGLVAIQASGQPLGETTIRIRGVQTLAAGAEPLYVVDGFPLYNDNLVASAGFRLGPPMNALAFLHPGDVQSIEILKDAAATAIYGARGANGVVLVNTKSGKTGRSGIELTTFTGFQEPIGRYNLLNGEQFAAYINEARNNAGLGSAYSNPAAFGQGTDWQEEIYRSSPALHNYHLGFQGGTNRLAYRLSAAYTKGQGLIRNSDFDRFNLQGNIDVEASDRLSVKNHMNISFTLANTIASNHNPSEGASLGVVGAALVFNPLLSPVDSEGNPIILNEMVDEKGLPTGRLQAGTPVLNPLAQLGLTDSEVQNMRLFNSLSLGYKISTTLTLNFNAGVNLLLNEENFFASGDLQPNQSIGGLGASGRLQSINWVNEYILQYQKSFDENRKLLALAGFSLQAFNSEILSGTSQNFENETLGFYNLGVGANKLINSNFKEWSLFSFFTHLNYRANDKYSFSFSGRADASSRFKGDYAFFPSLSFGWDISKEDFYPIKNLDMRLRASFGWSGNQEIAPYSTLSVLRQFESPLGNQSISGFRPVNLANDDLEIERTRQINLGIDLGSTDGRWVFSADLYSKNTDNALIFLPLPANSGFPFSLANAAEISNAGFDLTIYRQNTQGAILWNSGLNLGFYHNEIKAIDSNFNIPVGAPLLDIEEWSVLQAGASIGSFWGYQTDQILQSGGDPRPAFAGQQLQAGDRKYRDLNGDGVINRNDKSIIGNALPKWSFGLFNELSWKDFQLSFLFQGLAGHDIFNANKFLLESRDGQTNNTLESFNNRWTTQNITNSNPRLSASDKQTVFSDAQLENGAYLRLKNLSLAYNLPENLLQQWGLAKLQIFLSVQNLFTITNYSGIDPDVSRFGQSVLETGVDFDGYPQAKVYGGGLRIGF